MPRKAKQAETNAAELAEQALQQSEGKPLTDPAKEKKTGRPSAYSKEKADIICELLSDGVPLREICRMEGMPAWRTVYDWMYKDDVLGEEGSGLSAAIARAREIGYDAMAEECLIIADTPHIGTKKVFSSGSDEDEDSMTVTEEDMLGHRKLQIETRLKLLAKFNPKKYGDKVQVGGDPGNPLEIKNDAMDILAAAVKNLELKRQSANG